MADVYVNALTEQLTEPSTTDSMVMVNRSTNEGKIIDYNKLADVILAKLTSKQYDSLTTASKLLPGAINELDADAVSMSNSISALNSRLNYLGSFNANGDSACIKQACQVIRTTFSSEISATGAKPILVAFFRNGVWGFVGYCWFRTNTIILNLTRTNDGTLYIAQQLSNDADVTVENMNLANALINIGSATGSYTSMDDLPNNKICWLNQAISNAPGGATRFAGYALTSKLISTHGFQLAIAYAGNAMHIRAYVDGTWKEWKSISMT